MTRAAAQSKQLESLRAAIVEQYGEAALQEIEKDIADTIRDAGPNAVTVALYYWEGVNIGEWRGDSRYQLGKLAIKKHYEDQNDAT